MNSFSMCSLHRMQSFRRGLLQCGSPMGHRSCHKTCQGPVPARALCGLQLHLGHIPGPHHGVLHGCCVDMWISALSWSSMGCRGTTCATMVFMACREISAPASAASSLPLSSLTLVPAGLFHIFSLPSHSCCTAFFNPSLNLLPQRCPAYC